MLRDYRLTFKYLILLIVGEGIIAFFNMKHMASYEYDEFRKVAELFYQPIGYNSTWYFFLFIVSGYVIFLNYILKNDTVYIVRGKRVHYCKRNNKSALKLALFFAISNGLTTFFLITFFCSTTYYNITLIGFVLLNGAIYTVLLYCFSQVYFLLKNFLNKNLWATFITIGLSCLLYFGVFKNFQDEYLYIYRSLYITRAYFALNMNPEYVFYLGKVLSDILAGIFLSIILVWANERTVSRYEFF